MISRHYLRLIYKSNARSFRYLLFRGVFLLFFGAVIFLHQTIAVRGQGLDFRGAVPKNKIPLPFGEEDLGVFPSAQLLQKLAADAVQSLMGELVIVKGAADLLNQRESLGLVPLAEDMEQLVVNSPRPL